MSEGKRADAKQLLLVQYKILEERRNYFGRLFWQLPAFFIGLFTLMIGMLSREVSSFIQKCFFFVNGLLFLLIAYIARRLHKSQDECETLLAKLEDQMRRDISSVVIRLPSSRRRGARFWTNVGLALCGITLLVIWILLLLSEKDSSNTSPMDGLWP